jgi:hypothetical protein
MRHGSGESTDGAPVTDQRSTMAATATRWLLPAVDHDHLAVDGVSRELGAPAQLK